jgi:hypothetical protein
LNFSQVMLFTVCISLQLLNSVVILHLKHPSLLCFQGFFFFFIINDPVFFNLLNFFLLLKNVVNSSLCWQQIDTQRGKFFLEFLLQSFKHFIVHLTLRIQLLKVAYAYAAWKFSFHFLNRSSVEEFNMLWNQLKNDLVSQSRLLQLKKRMRNDVATEVLQSTLTFSFKLHSFL